MKKILMVVFAVAISCSAMAQSKMMSPDTSMHKMSKSSMNGSVMMKDGKMMCMKNGTTMAMEKTMTMKNGTKVMTDGTVKMKDGKTMMLKDGQCVMMSGKVTSMPMKSGMSKM